MENPKGIRAFIGIDCTEAVKEALEDVQFDLMEMVGETEVNWVKPNTMHLTLFFLGDHVQAAAIPKICDGLDKISNGVMPFDLALEQIDAFPNRKAPRILWVGLEDESNQLQTLKKEIDGIVAPLGWQPEKRGYNPHLTIGYVKRGKTIDPRKAPFGSAVTPVRWSVKHIHLYHSKLTKNGPRYNRIHTTELGR